MDSDSNSFALCQLQSLKHRQRITSMKTTGHIHGAYKVKQVLVVPHLPGSKGFTSIGVKVYVHKFLQETKGEERGGKKDKCQCSMAEVCR
jgi:hypothetical protein